MPKVYILLPVHNRKEITRGFVECLAAQTFSDYHLVLIDDGSTDGTAEMVQARISSTAVLKGNGDWWWAGSLQQGIDWLEQHGVEEQEIVAFANDDTTFEGNFLQRAIELLECLGSVLLLPYLHDKKTGVPQESGVRVDFQKFTFEPAPSAEAINCLPTRWLFMRMRDLRRIGRFHTVWLPHYWSDYEFTVRAHRKGLKLCTSADLVIGFDGRQSGYRSFEDAGFFKFLGQYFSKKSVLNPVYQSSFILLACPLRHVPVNICRTWRNAFVHIVRRFKHSARKRFKRAGMTKAIRNSGSSPKIIVGAGCTQYQGWVSTDRDILNLLNENDWRSYFHPEMLDAILAEHVWEHLTSQEAEIAVRFCLRYLRPGGHLRLAVPDGYHRDANYLDQVRPGGSGEGADDHKVLYNYRTLSELLQRVGYKVQLLEWFDEEGHFHHEDWDEADGFVSRSTRYDPRNRVNPTEYTSLIVDAIKPQ
jgi:predicted SAM-dependent methyltransferase/GT2 family glycosyltransferase